MRFWPSPCARTCAAVLDGLESAWVFFGGVVKRLVEDNLKPAVTRADRYTPSIDRVFLEYAQYRGFVVDPAVVRHATGKPKVERGIPYCRQDFFRGETFRDLADLQARAVRWCREIAGTRVHGTTRQVPRVVFEAVEQPTLLPLSAAPFDRPTWATPRSIPILTSSSATRSTRCRPPTSASGPRSAAILAWCAFNHHGELVKVHAVQPRGGRATDYADYPAERAPTRCAPPTPAVVKPSRSAPPSASS